MAFIKEQQWTESSSGLTTTSYNFSCVAPLLGVWRRAKNNMLLRLLHSLLFIHSSFIITIVYSAGLLDEVDADDDDHHVDKNNHSHLFHPLFLTFPYKGWSQWILYAFQSTLYFYNQLAHTRAWRRQKGKSWWEGKKGGKKREKLLVQYGRQSP